MAKLMTDEGYIYCNGIAVPVSVLDEITVELQAKKKAAEAIKFVDDPNAPLAEIEDIKRVFGDKPKKKKDEPQPWVDPLADYDGPRVHMYTYENVEAFVENFETTCVDSDQRKRTSSMLDGLAQAGQYRKLKTLPERFRRDIAEMRLAYPNFSEVLDYISSCAEISSRTDGILRLNPILLVGGPGTGKSMMSQAIARWLDSGYLAMDLASAQCNSELAGSSSFWSNAQCSKLFSMLTKKMSYANPVIHLDEIDKTSGGAYDPLGPLYTLLEKGSASSFTDACYAIPLDASHATWIATANDTTIPDALLSRFRVFNISITQEQAKSIAISIVHDTVDNLRLPEDIVFTPSAIDVLAAMTPRRIKQAVTEAIGRVLGRDRDTVHPSDIVVETIARQRMGFV